MLKPPRLPHPGSPLEAKYTAAQMKAYALKAMELEREACATVCLTKKAEYRRRAETSSKAIPPEMVRVAADACDYLADEIRKRGTA